MSESTRPTPTLGATIPCSGCGRLNRVDLARGDDRPTCGACGAPLTLDQPILANDETLERVLRDAAVPVIVDFYADWCGPCRTMAPTFAELARRRAGQAMVLKLDTDRSPAMAIRYGIRSIPTLIVFREGREMARQVGAVPLGRLEELLGAGI